MSSPQTAAITAVHGWLPEDILSNADLEKMVDTNDEWIRTRTGISERRILKDPEKATSDMACEVIKGLCAQRGITPEEVDLVIVATVTPDMFFPSTAQLACHKAGASNAWGFDLSAACSGFLFALRTGSQFVASGTHSKVIVVGADKMSSIVDYTDRTTCVLFGDAASGVLLAHAPHPLPLPRRRLCTSWSCFPSRFATHSCWSRLPPRCRHCCLPVYRLLPSSRPCFSFARSPLCHLV